MMPMRVTAKSADPMPLLDIAALRRLERAHAADALMERAGSAAAEWALAIRADDARPVLVVAGPGNNGGDAAVVARLLARQGVALCFVAFGDPGGRSPDAAAAFAALAEAGIAIEAALPAGASFSLVVDGLFGVGLTRPLSGEMAAAVMAIQMLAGNGPLLALDCPSGLDAGTGDCPGPAVRATHTLSFIAGKPGLLTGDGPDHVGQLAIDGLGIAETEIAALATGQSVASVVLDEALPRRRQNSHKGDFGSLGILGGAPGMVGAALLAGRAALKLGCGRVYVGLRDDRVAFDPGQPELMLRNPSGLAKAQLDALVCGPGLGTDNVADALLVDILQSPLPLVLDADALTLIAADGLACARLRTRHAATLMTPHPGEAARMLRQPVREIMRDRVAAACRLADEFNAWVALKGCGTVIAAPGGAWWINTSGNPLLASAGTGDVLAGFIGTFLAQRRSPQTALLAGVHLHGLAADSVAARGLHVGMTAGELAGEAALIASRRLAGAPEQQPR
jgi:hydroxyethylthiazole kinase-like uncharacterized protein yjeF